jgi:parallel beta-helix repeat protein
MQTKSLLKKGLVAGIILLFIGTCIIPANAQNTEKPLPASKGNWLYVGGSGPGNYTKIQDAIDFANPGDTVFVYSGMYASEQGIIFDKSITLLGEDKYTTIIDGSEFFQFGIYISPRNIMNGMLNISGFTIHYFDCGLIIAWYELSREVRINISNNVITECNTGLEINGGKNFTVFSNIIENNNRGIELTGQYFGENNYFTQNTFKNNYNGILCDGYGQQIYQKNNFEDNEKGIVLSLDSSTTITHNNFINNGIDTEIKDTGFVLIPLSILPRFHTKWDGNYWDEWVRISPKPMRAKYYLIFYLGGEHGWDIILGPFLFFKFDWHPAQEPYNIPVMS